MADLCCVYQLGAVLTLNDMTDGVDALVIAADGISGLDGAPIRRQIDPAGQEDGGLVHQGLFGARIITFKGFVVVRSVPKGQNATYYGALVALEENILSGLEGILNTPTTLSWTPTGGSAKSLSVIYGTDGGELQFTGSMLDKEFQFTLVAEAPTIL